MLANRPAGGVPPRWTPPTPLLRADVLASARNVRHGVTARPWRGLPLRVPRRALPRPPAPSARPWRGLRYGCHAPRPLALPWLPARPPRRACRHAPSACAGAFPRTPRSTPQRASCRSKNENLFPQVDDLRVSRLPSRTLLCRSKRSVRATTPPNTKPQVDGITTRVQGRSEPYGHVSAGQPRVQGSGFGTPRGGGRRKTPPRNDPRFRHPPISQPRVLSHLIKRAGQGKGGTGVPVPPSLRAFFALRRLRQVRSRRLGAQDAPPAASCLDAATCPSGRTSGNCP